MNHADFENAARDIVVNYWRIRAALAFFRQAPRQYTGELKYDGIPLRGAIVGILANETVDNALNALTSYAVDRLVRDLFIALIARFEARLSAYIISAGGNGTGTLGLLQSSVQQLVTISTDRKEELDEVRERRNMLMHHDGVAQQRYVQAAQRVNNRAGPFVPIPNVGDLVLPDAQYLTYAADVLIAYSAAL